MACAEFCVDHPRATTVLDVHDPEPVAETSPLLEIDNGHLSPHSAGATTASTVFSATDSTTALATSPSSMPLGSRPTSIGRRARAASRSPDVNMAWMSVAVVPSIRPATAT